MGATVILYPEWPDALAVAEIVKRFKPTVLLSVPTFFRNLLREGVADSEDFKNIRYFITAGEKLPQSLFDQWLAETGKPMLEGIGATETCFLFLSNRPNQIRPGTCGIPTPGTKVKLIGEDGNIITKPMKTGVLWVAMDCVASSYWNMEELTSQVFQEGWYCTNDMFTCDADGYYEYQGRADDMLKISGQWVSPAEIEEQVLLHEDVSEAAVVGAKNRDGLIRLALFIVAKTSRGRSDELKQEVAQMLTTNLAIYKCPRTMYFLDEMPLTVTGKLKRFVLRQFAEKD